MPRPFPPQASAVTQPFAGRFQDRFGGRLCIPAALVLLAVFLWIVAVAKSAGIVLLGFVGLRTFGLGMLDTFTAACVNQARGRRLQRPPPLCVDCCVVL